MESFSSLGEVSITIAPSTFTVDVVTSTPPFPGRLQRQVAVPSTFTLLGESREPEVNLSRSTSEASEVSRIESLPVRFNSEGVPQWDTFFRENANLLESIVRSSTRVPSGAVPIAPGFIPRTLPPVAVPAGLIQPPPLERGRYYDPNYVSLFRIGGEGMTVAPEVEVSFEHDDSSPELSEVRDLFSGV